MEQKKVCKRMTKYEIAVACENLPGVRPWTAMSSMTVFYDRFTRSELVDIYNDFVDRHSLSIPHIS